MSDIFISYSSKDREKAEQLTELLASAGLSVWIDQSGIPGAEQWATEIVEGIRACSTFILLLSPESVASQNVLKELSLASEKRKRISSNPFLLKVSVSVCSIFNCALGMDKEDKREAISFSILGITFFLLDEIFFADANNVF